ncbi:MAG TPA: alpha/beta hydrolase family protein [Terriglobales bacterium]|nr:alpha/beta hydrolase family protein [Terriglobales bacterium]
MISPTADAASRVECATAPSRFLKASVRYCALLPPGYDADKTRRYPVLYFLHGLGDNEQSLVNGGGWNIIERMTEEKKLVEMIVVTPDGGRGFYINSRDGRTRYEDFFIREFVPAMDRKYRTVATRAGRGLSGVSMGGYGALRFAFQYPQLFGSVSAHSAAVMKDLPRGADAAPGIGGGRTSLLGTVFGSPLDHAFYQRQNPVTLARQSAGLRRLKIYFDCGTEDEYGFDAGAQALHEALESRRIPHEFHLYPGGHGWQYVARHFDASLTFHSQAFGRK